MEIVGVTKERYLARLVGKQPWVDVDNVGAELVGVSTWIPRKK